MLPSNSVAEQKSAVEVATVLSTHATVAESIVSPPLYVVPSTGVVEVANGVVEARMTMLSRSFCGGVVYEISTPSVVVATVRVVVLLPKKTETEAEPLFATAKSG